ncbi:MAG TPA: integration host factor, actinobacterial type [Streptosporangiaceae bacterium]|nr:integration host factor, actinobacterial type [Streptosporangiaceae bacterium]
MALPELTPETLEKAAEARRAKYAALAEVTAGTLPVADVLTGNEPRLLKVKVRRVLIALPGIGKVRADRMLAEAGIDPERRVKGLLSAPRQQEKLTALLAA